MTSPGRRARAKAEKRARILAAADRLFAEQGYAATTTQQVADAADVAAGTVFSYAASKVELLMMVVNERLRKEVRHGIDRSAQTPGTEEAIAALLEPVIELARGHRENFVVFAREVIFGSDGEHHAAAVETVEEVTAAIAEILRASGRLRPGVDAERAGRAVFSVVLFEINRARRGRDTESFEVTVTDQVRTILQGAQVAPEADTTPRTGRKAHLHDGLRRAKTSRSTTSRDQAEVFA